MARRGENIYLRKDGRYEGRYIKGRRADGRPIFGSIYARRYGEVKCRLAQVKAQLVGERAALAVYGNGTLGDWAHYYLESQVRPQVRPGTYANYRRNLDRHIGPLLGGEMLARLTPAHIQAAARQLQTRLAAGTLRGVFWLLKSVLAAAVDKGLLLQSPYREIRLPRSGPRAPRVLSAGEQKKLEEGLRRGGALEHLLCLYTGLRVGEVCALRWEDIDFDNSLLHVRHAVKRLGRAGAGARTRLTLGPPKSDTSLRHIPLPAFLLAMLQSARREGDAGFLFKGVKGGMRDPRTLQKKLGRICKKLNLAGVHMHTLRHSFATRCLEQGVGVEVLSALLGHSSPQITLRYYAHCTPEAMRRGMTLLAAIA